MRAPIAILLLSAGAAFAADQDFNGRWDITAKSLRAYWLEVTGAPANPSGYFVSAYGGDRNKIDSIAIKDGELVFSFNPPPPRDPTKAVRTPVYRARLVNGKLEGSFGVPGASNPPTQFTGVRAPVIADKDDGSWKEGKPIPVFNGKDLTGWKALNPSAEMKW